MTEESNIFINIIIVLLALLVLGLAAGTASATHAVPGFDTGLNVTISATSATGISAPLNITQGAIITVYFNNTNTTATWNINATNQNVSINGGLNYSTITDNGTFTLNSSVPTDVFNVTVSNADNVSENATLTGFRFVLAPVYLGNASNFVILAGSAITGGGTNVITGDVGLSPTGGAAITLLTCAEVTGTIYDIDDLYKGGGESNTACQEKNPGLLTTTKNDLITAYNDAAGRTPASAIVVELGSITLTPGVYSSGTFEITGNLTLDGHGDPNAVFIFKMTTTLTTATNSSVVLVNGTQAANVFWQVGSSATLGTYSTFKGTILAKDSITLTTGANVEGRVLARDAAVTLNGANVITVITVLPPTISYNTPPTAENNSVVTVDYFAVNVTAYSLTLKNITINLYNKTTGTLFTPQVTIGDLLSTSTFQVIFSKLSNGDYLFNATAYDTSGNSNTTVTRNVTVLFAGCPDLNLTSQNITFVYDTGEAADVTEAGEARENINLTINATIYNGGTASSGAFYVLFYDSNSEFYNVSMNSISAGDSAHATAYWTTLAGTHNITVMVDPNCGTGDCDPSNNNASKLINVSAWQKYYGNAAGNYILANNLATSMKNWTWNNIGYLYVVNQSANINWSALHPLGYDKNNDANSSGQDFQDADTNLGLVAGTNNAIGFQNNNITELFTNAIGSNYGNVAINTTSFVIFGNTINNVPVVNSTDMTNHNAVDSANFITGILWDHTNDTNGYYDTDDKEDLVFITKIRPASSGLQGSAHNYEIAVPYSLNLMTGHEVGMYMELT